MRDLKEILNEVHEQLNDDNCQSWNSICLISMEKAMNESKREIIEQLEEISNNYEIISGCYVISKKVIDNYIEKLEIL